MIEWGRNEAFGELKKQSPATCKVSGLRQHELLECAFFSLDQVLEVRSEARDLSIQLACAAARSLSLSLQSLSWPLDRRSRL
jgi:hypothetical protein